MLGNVVFSSPVSCDPKGTWKNGNRHEKEKKPESDYCRKIDEKGGLLGLG